MCVHGWPQHWWMYRGLLTGLSDRHRVIALDLRGYGWSDVPRSGYEKERFASDVLGVLDALELDRVRLVGHDWGGITGFLACLRAPERFERFLALNCGHPFPSPSLPRLLSLWRFAYQPLVAAPVVGPLLSRRAVPGAVARVGTTWDAAEREIYLAPLRDPERARAASLTYRTFLVREAPAWGAGRYRGRRLEVETLMLHGTRDAALPPHMLGGFEEHVPGGTLELVPGVGHFIVDEVGDLVLDRARSFFA